MRIFDYKEDPKKLLTPEIVALMGNIREMKGKQELFIEADADILTSLLEVAKIQSTESSNRIEGIYTSDLRLRELVEKKTEPRNPSEQEIAGYRDALSTIHENYDYIPIEPNLILQLHRDLYSFSGIGFGGNYKNADNVIAEIHSDGRESVHFRPVSAFETKGAVEDLCQAFKQAITMGEYDPIILTSMFVLDFLCIHPFNDGNGRLSRLLTLLLLYKSGYLVGKYVSLELLIEQTKESYYEALQDSSIGWHEQKNDYEYFTRYLLGIIQKAYLEFGARVEHLKNRGLTKSQRVESIINKSIKPISKSEILKLAPDISKITVERALKNLQDDSKIRKIGQGKSTKYIKK